MVLMLNGAPQVIEDFHVSGTAQTKHKLHVRLRHLRSGRVTDRQFAENERTAVADMQHRTVQFSYKQGNTYAFLDAESFEELDLTAEQVGERHWFFKENEECRAMFLDGKLLDIVLPGQATLRIEDTAPPVRGGSDSTWKPATLETGLEIMVPLFLDKGETRPCGHADAQIHRQRHQRQGEVSDSNRQRKVVFVPAVLAANLRQMANTPTRPPQSADSVANRQHAVGSSPLPELLAPAGDWDCARAAVENGADAIYFALEKFNARIRANNFTAADLPKLMEFLHRRGVRGYACLNTLVFENEMAEAEADLRAMIAAGVDAVLVQDVGIAG